jgi:acyl carrier protein
MTLIREFVQNLGLDGAACSPESELRSLGIDSLQAVDLVFQLEERFGMQIPMEQFNAKTVGDAIAFVVSISGIPAIAQLGGESPDNSAKAAGAVPITQQRATAIT